MTRAHTTTFLFRSADYFVAMTDSGAVRIGMVGGVCFDVPQHHANFGRIVDATIESKVEALHDELSSLYA